MTGIDTILQNSKLEEPIKQLIKAAYLLGRTEAITEMKNLIPPVENDGSTEFESERWTL